MKHTQTITPHGGFNKLENMENNKLIAEFMGFQETSIGWYDADECLHEKDNTFDTLKFNVDWNWLMKVVEKIENLGYGVTIGMADYCVIQNDWKEDMKEIYSMTKNGKLLCVYDACVEFINWHNKND